MTCVYTFTIKGGKNPILMTFNSESELDEFLLTHKQHINTDLDVVYSLTPELVTAKDILDNIRVSSQELKKAKPTRVFDEDGKTWKYEPPYIGVNAYISQYVDPEGNKITPVFVEDNYWYGVLQPDGVTRIGGRTSAWKGDGVTGVFTETEAEILIKKGVTLKKLAQGSDKWEGPAIVDKNKAEELKNDVKTKWEYQCLTGDAVHLILETLLKEHNKTQLWRDAFLSATTPEAHQKLAESFRKHLNSRTFKGSNGDVTFESLMSDEMFKSTLDGALSFMKHLKERFGDKALYFPEFTVSGDLLTPAANGAKKMLGVIDLLVVDERGNVHIFDYKTSTKDYEDYHSAKRLTFRYQLAAYLRILEQHGFQTSLKFNGAYYENSLAIVPIKLKGMEKNGKDSYKCSSVEFLQDSRAKTPYYEQALEIFNSGGDHINEELCNILVPPRKKVTVAGSIVANTKDWMDKAFPKYSRYKEVSDEELKKELEECGALKVQTEGEHAGMLVYLPKGSKRRYPIVVDPAKHPGTAEAEMFQRVKRFKEHAIENRAKLVETIQGALARGTETGSVDEAARLFPEGKLSDELLASPEWFKAKMEKYCHDGWEVYADTGSEQLALLGIICMHHKRAHVYDFIKISPANLTYQEDFKTGNTNIAGSHHEYSDSLFKQDDSSLVLEGRRGNIELMETMAAIQQMQSLFGDRDMLGDIQVINPIDGYGMAAATNRELVWNFNLLNGIVSPGEKSPFGDTIKVADQAHKALILFNQIMWEGKENNWIGSGYQEFHKRSDEYSLSKFFEPCQAALFSCIDGATDVKIARLQELAEALRRTDSQNRLRDLKPSASMEYYNDVHTQLYFLVQLAIAELSKIDYRQQLDDHSEYGEWAQIMTKGLSSTAIDNPGSMESQLLNQMTKLTTQAYQKVRDRMLDPIAETKKRLDKLKLAKGFGKLKELTFGNQTALFNNMIDKTKADFRFKTLNDPSLTPEEVEFLEYALDVINKNRYPTCTPEELEKMKTSGSPEYYRIPLMTGGSAAAVAQKGVIQGLKDALKWLNPKVAAERAREKLEGFITPQEMKKRQEPTYNFFQMTNRFDAGENEISREHLLNPNLNKTYETNIEKIILSHCLAYTAKEELDKVMPMLHAGMINLQRLGELLNTVFTKDLQWMHDYIKNKIRNESLQSETAQEGVAAISTLQRATSALALGMAPVQMTYQLLLGIWNDVGFIWRKDDGTNAFSWNNFRKAFKIVYSDMLHFSTTPTVISRINELMGINDLDMQTYAKNNSQDKHGIWNFDNFLFRFTSRPDYYNRMSLVVCKMLEDGSFEAHSLKDGKLVYDWTKDARYAEFAKNPTSTDPKVVEQRALYVAQALEFMREGATVIVDGKEVPFTLNLTKPMPLPRAYTNKEAESIKDIADNCYGYYSHEKKSMIQSRTIGALFLLMKTYWSSKKNQYLGSSGVKLLGHWEVYKENGEAYYYQIDDNGNVLWDLPPVKESEATNKTLPVVKWKGDWREGVLLTLTEFCRTWKDNNYNLSTTISLFWYNEDQAKQLVYRANTKRLAYDLFMWMVLGPVLGAILLGWEKDIKENEDMDEVGTELKFIAVDLLTRTVRNSFLDFNVLDSLVSPVTTWTPFAFSYATSELENACSTVFGSKSWADGLLSSASSLRMWKPLLRSLED